MTDAFPNVEDNEKWLKTVSTITEQLALVLSKKQAAVLNGGGQVSFPPGETGVPNENPIFIPPPARKKTLGKRGFRV